MDGIKEEDRRKVGEFKAGPETVTRESENSSGYGTEKKVIFMVGRIVTNFKKAVAKTGQIPRHGASLNQEHSSPSSSCGWGRSWRVSQGLGDRVCPFRPPSVRDGTH